MALQQLNESEEEYHSVAGDGEDETELETDTEQAEAEAEVGSDDIDEPPVHPVPSMQAAFEESILESTEDDDSAARPTSSSNAEARRRKLLESQQYDDTWTARWKQRPGSQFHPLSKLMAQIVFGMHLLQQQQAKSNEEVVKILQAHVNEVDTFLERTSDDFDLAITDIEERIRHLKLPMTHLEVFDVMLDEKKFRNQLLDGNDKIEKIIDRTARAMNAALMDIQKGLQATRGLGSYLDTVEEQWPRNKRDLSEVFGAMRGNEQGWIKYLKDLQVKGNNLGNNLIQLGTVIGELSRLAAAASRRTRPTSRPTSPTPSAPTPGLRSKFARVSPPPMPPVDPMLNKPLPKEPDTVGGAAQMTMPRLHPVPFAQRYESPRASPRSPAPRSPATSPVANGGIQRPKTAGTPRDARAREDSTAELAEFFRASSPAPHSNPLESNPPDTASGGLVSENAGKTLSRSTSHGAVDLLKAASAAKNEIAMARSRTTGANAMFDRARDRTESQSTAVTVAPEMHSIPSEPVDRKDSVASNGFTRRVSKRMKDILATEMARSPLEDVQTEDTLAPADSARPSDAEKQQTLEPLEEIPKEEPRPPSRLGLFPKTTEAGTSSATSTRSPEGSMPLTTTTVPAPYQAPSGRALKIRSFSLRKVFNRKHKVGYLVA